MSLQADIVDGQVRVNRWDVGTLAWVPWDGSLTTGALTIGTVNQGTGGSSAWKVDGSAVTQPVSAASLPLPSGAATAALQLPDGHNVTVDNASGASAVNIQDGGNTITVDGTVTAVTVPAAPGSVSQASVNDTNASGTLLSSNANRVGATIYNDSDQHLFLKLGATASTSSFTCRVVSHGYYEVPYRYTGVIDGIWAANSTGAARITELTI